MKNYIAPEIDIVKFSAEDIITASSQSITHKNGSAELDGSEITYTTPDGAF